MSRRIQCLVSHYFVRFTAIMLAVLLISTAIPAVVFAEAPEEALLTEVVDETVDETVDEVVDEVVDETVDETVDDTTIPNEKMMAAFGAPIEPLGAQPSGMPQATMTTTANSISFGYSATDTVYVDWGDGNPVEYTSGENHSSSGSIKVYCDGDITKLELNYSGLRTLDVTKCSGLEILECEDNQLTELDVTKNTALTYLDFSHNQLTELDLTKNTALTALYCAYTQLTKLDVTKNTALTELNCSGSQLTELDLTDLTKNTALTVLYCGYNQLTELDVTKNTALINLVCCDNRLTELDVTKNTALELLVCENNQLTELDLTKNTALRGLYCVNNQLTNLDLTKNAQMVSLQCSQNKLTFSSIKTVNAIEELMNEYVGYHPYAPQAAMTIPAEKAANAAIDLTSEWSAHGTETVYVWHDASTGNVVTPTSSLNGVFTFGTEFAGKTLYCEMTNASLPDLTLTTTKVTIRSAAATVILESNDATVSQDSGSTYVYEDGQPFTSGKIMLLVGNVDGNSKETVLDAVESYNKAFDADSKDYAIYDIHLEDANNNKVELENGRIKITMKIPDNFTGKAKDYNLKLYHYDEKAGKLESIPITLSSGNTHYTFYADSFSPYILTWTKKLPSDGNAEGDTSETGDSLVGIFTAINLMLIAAMVLHYSAKRRKCDHKND